MNRTQQGFLPASSFQLLAPVLVSRAHRPSRRSSDPVAVPVIYRDGLTLTYLFDRSTRISDLMAAISRAGQVRKVVLL